MPPDPLVTLWHDTRRPLASRPWQTLSAGALAHLRALLIAELRDLEAQGEAVDAWHWRHAHRQLLEIKAATGQARPPDGHQEEHSL